MAKRPAIGGFDSRAVEVKRKKISRIANRTAKSALERRRNGPVWISPGGGQVVPVNEKPDASFGKFLMGW